MDTNSIHARPDEDRRTELDEVFEALADAKRRAVLEVLQERQRASLEELATAIAGDGQSTSRVEIELHHRHLPRLADAGIVRYDADHICELDTDTMPLRVLETATSASSDGA